MDDSRQQLILFPTIAGLDEDQQIWQGDVHGWCYDLARDQHFQRTTAGILRRALKLDRDEPDPPFFRERVSGFVVDNGRKVIVEVGHGATRMHLLKTKRNGHFRASISVPAESIQSLSKTLHGTNKTSLAVRRTDCELVTQGDWHLIPAQGISIISDIDDTIKFSNVGNKDELLANTFLRPFRAIEGMSELFQRLAAPDRSFHYISASPWQLYETVLQFLSENHFPEGSIYLRKFDLKDVTILKKIFPAHKKKQKVIDRLISQFPQRRFLLFGDTGERDADIYGEMARKYPDQILGICLRNVTYDSPDSLRFRRSFVNVPSRKWIIFEDVMRLESQFLSEIMGFQAQQPFVSTE